MFNSKTDELIPMPDDVIFVPKVCAYITRTRSDSGRPELLVFEGPRHDGLQIPKGTIEDDETVREALDREVEEESGLSTLGAVSHLASDVWTRRRSPPKRYRRHFFHATVDVDREEWTHTVSGVGAEAGLEFSYFWVEVPPSTEFALSLDDYVHLLIQSQPQ